MQLPVFSGIGVFMKDEYNLAWDAVSWGVKSAGELNACIKAIEF